MNRRSGKLAARIIKVGHLTGEQIDQMWRLFAQGYDGVNRDQFAHDLAAKQAVFYGLDSGDGSFQGFSTFELYEHICNGNRVKVIFCGDTMVQPDYWGQTAMHSAFARVVALERLRQPFAPLYWFLTAMGYRTYMIMARNFPQRYWPRYDVPTPPWIQALIGSLAFERYGAAWDELGGVIRFAKPQGALAGHVAPITAEIRSIPEVDFLVRKNPEYAQGVELACVAEITIRDLLRFAGKTFRKRLVRAAARSVASGFAANARPRE